MRRALLLPTLLLVLTQSVAAEDGPHLTTLAAWMPRLEALADEVAQRLEILLDRLADMHDDLLRGFGWYTGDNQSYSSVGTVREGWMLEVTPQALVLRSHLSPGEESPEQLSIQRTADPTTQARWLYYRTCDPEVELWCSILPGDQAGELVVDWADGPRLETSGEGYLIRMPGNDDHWYHTIPWSPPGGDLTVGPQLMLALVGPTATVPHDVAADFVEELLATEGTSYPLRILADALGERAETRSIPAIGAYAANWLRRTVGLPAWRREGHLETAAEAHSRAVVASGKIDTLLGAVADGATDEDTLLGYHWETPEMTGFSGEGPIERATTAGYPHLQVGENGNFGTDVVTSSYGWFFSVYHRRPWLQPEVREIGLAAYPPGETERVAITMKYGLPQADGGAGNADGLPPGQPFPVLPAPEEQDVPNSWAGIEAPDPMPQRRDPEWLTRSGLTPRTDGFAAAVGPPLSVYIESGNADAYELRLSDPEGALLELHRVTVWTDDRFLEAIPIRPLGPGTWYRAEVSGPGGSFSWRFRTAEPPALNPSVTRLRERLAHGAKRLLAAPIPSPSVLFAANTQPLSTRAVDGDRLVIEPFGFRLHLPDDFTVQPMPEAPWMIRLVRSTPSAAVDIVVHRLGDLREVDALWEMIEPTDWSWPLLGIDERNGVIHGSWDTGGTPAQVLLSIIDERGVSLWAYGMGEQETRALFAQITVVE